MLAISLAPLVIIVIATETWLMLIQLRPNYIVFLSVYSFTASETVV